MMQIKFNFNKLIFYGGFATAWQALSVDQILPDFFRPTRQSLSIASFRFWISPSVPKIFAIEVWSCPKSGQILHVFVRIFFCGNGLLNFSTGLYKKS